MLPRVCARNQVSKCSNGRLDGIGDRPPLAIESSNFE